MKLGAHASHEVPEARGTHKAYASQSVRIPLVSADTPCPGTSKARTSDECAECERIAADPRPLPHINSREGDMSNKLNWLRAGVLGANDGIVSTAGLVVGVAGATVSHTTLLISGIAGLAAGALSMAAGEYVSVSTQRDSEQSALAQQQKMIATQPAAAERRLAGLIAADGVSPVLAQRTAHELTQYDAIGAHAKYELGIDPYELTRPWNAAFASLISFILGAIIPLCAIILTPQALAIPITACAVTIALAITGSVSAKLGGARVLRATVRNVLWGAIAMAITYGIGAAVGTFT